LAVAGAGDLPELVAPVRKGGRTRNERFQPQPDRDGQHWPNSRRNLARSGPLTPMSALYRTMLRPLLFAQDSERIHDRTIKALAWAGRHPSVCKALSAFYSTEELPVELFGLRFPNPVGLAAGMDKAAAAVPVWAALGFGFTELGGVTRHPQPGNPTPRMFRVVKDRALINRMGFNNPGADAMALRLAAWKKEGRWPKHPAGINLGKSKITPLEEAVEDYVYSFKALWNYADFFVVNVSSPNTPNLRQLQDKAALDEILTRLQEANKTLALAPKPQPWLEPREEKKTTETSNDTDAKKE